MNELLVDALDLDIVDALQHDPRASWAAIGDLVDRSEVAVARRWNRMLSANLAWTGIALHPSASQGAFIEIRCRGEATQELYAALVEHPDLITVGSTTGDFNVYCIIIGVSLSAVLNRVDRGMPELGMCERVRVNLFHQITGGVDWKQEIIDLDSYSSRGRSQTEAIKEFRQVRRQTRESTPAPSDKFRDLFLALGSDARRPLKELGEVLGTSGPVVKRQITRLIEQRQIVFRCDVARPEFDYPIAMVLSLKTPPEHAEELAFRIGGWKETRFCASVASTANLILVAGLRDLPDGESFMAKLTALEIPTEVIQRCVNTRMIKVYGRILDDRGRAARHIPVDPWAAVSIG